MAIMNLPVKDEAHIQPATPVSETDGQELDTSLYYNFKSHLLKSGKICPKPWYWGRFCNVFQPKYEPYWLVNWWQTSNEEKRLRFLEQLDYLARETGRFREAYDFLCALEDKDWHYGIKRIILDK